MKSKSNYRNNRYGATGAYERDSRVNDSNYQSRYDNNAANTYGDRFPEDARGYSDAPSYDNDSHRGRKAYNSDTRRDSDAYNYRSSGGYGVQNNYDRSGLYNANAQKYNDRYDLSQPSSQWPQDHEHRTRRNNTNDAYRWHADNNGHGNPNTGSWRHEEDLRGYRGRSSEDYANSYGDPSYDPYNTYTRDDRRGYAYYPDEDYEREKDRSRYTGRYSWGREDEDQSKGSYGYYESYPSYGQSDSYSDHERYSGKTGHRETKTDQYGETDAAYRRNVRDRRSW